MAAPDSPAGAGATPAYVSYLARSRQRVPRAGPRRASGV